MYTYVCVHVHTYVCMYIHSILPPSCDIFKRSLYNIYVCTYLCIGFPIPVPVDQQTPSDPQRGVSTRSVSIKVPRLRRCASLDNTNNWYDKLLAERKTIQEINFIKRNKVSSILKAFC